VKSILVAFSTGLLFSLGLGLGGMTDPARVIGFLDFAGAWDPSLAFVMGGAVGTFALARLLILRRARPLLGKEFACPPTGGIDRRVVVGSLLFGAGWGLAGYCPGPAFASVASGALETLLFVGAMVFGMLLYGATRFARS